MDKNRIIGAGKQLTGTIKEAAGKVTGNTQLEAEGKIEATLGKGQVALGEMTDKVKDLAKDAAAQAEQATAALKAKLDKSKV